MHLLLLSLMDDRPAPAGDEEQVQHMVSLATQGDEIATQRLYRRYVGRVFRAVRPLAVSDAEADDVVQDTFVKALGSLPRYQRRPDKRFVAWLMTIALNTARSQARRHQRWRPLRESAAQDSGADAPPVGTDVLGDALDRRRAADALLLVLGELSEHHRRIVLLRYGAELTATEVGQLCGETPASIRKICQRQREKLLHRLARVMATPQTERPPLPQGATP